jgi:aspartate racemase
MISTVSPRRVHRIVGVIGGMGPEATVELMRRVIAKTPAQDDQDHVHLIVENNPKIPSRVKHLIEGTGADPTPELTRIAQNLERAGADALAMPCNTAHAYADAIVEAVSIPLLDMIEATAAQINTTHPRARVGLLASSAVHRTKVFAEPLQRLGMKQVLPQRQPEVMSLITRIKRGDTGPDAQNALRALAAETSKNCDVLLVACSELSVISNAIDVDFVDSVDVLATEIIRFAADQPRPTSHRPRRWHPTRLLSLFLRVTSQGTSARGTQTRL